MQLNDFITAFILTAQVPNKANLFPGTVKYILS